MARILVLSFSPIAADARVLKQVALLAATHDVTTCGYGPAPEGVARHLELPSDAPVAWHRAKLALVTRRYRAVYDGSAAIRAARRLLASEDPFDVVLANDVESVPLALELSPRCGVHADLHEYAPRQNEDDRRWRLVVAPYIRWLVRRFVARAASVTTVGQGLADEYRREFGIEADVVVNATPLARLAPSPLTDDRPIRLVHTGAGLRNRHLEVMIDAVATATRPVTLDIYLTPNNPDYLGELRACADGVAGVRLLDPLPYAELVPTINAYDVGVFVLPPVNFNYRWALPNKLFDFVQARLGVIVGPSPEMARVVTEHGLGVVTDDFTSVGLARVLDTLTPEDVRGWKVAAHEAAESLSAQSQVLVWGRAVERLLARAGGERDL